MSSSQASGGTSTPQSRASGLQSTIQGNSIRTTKKTPPSLDGMSPKGIHMFQQKYSSKCCERVPLRAKILQVKQEGRELAVRAWGSDDVELQAICSESHTVCRERICIDITLSLSLSLYLYLSISLCIYIYIYICTYSIHVCMYVYIYKDRDI